LVPDPVARPMHERSVPDSRSDLEPIADLRVTPEMTVRELLDGMYRGGGFSAKKVAIGAEIFNKMASEDVTTILSFPACLMATGVRGVLAGMVKDGLVDAIITTCGTLDHDLARLWRHYYQGSFQMDDVKLHQLGINRLGNVLVPNESYGEILEEKLQPWIREMYAQKKEWSTAEICREFGRRIAELPNREESLLYWCYERNVPIYVPGPTDGSVGSQFWMFYQNHRDFRFDLLKDEQDLSDLTFKAKQLGALMLGGGISKHHTIWWSQFRDGLDYAIYITTAVEYDGSLSGARLEEAISWGKIKEDARIINIEGDVSVILPLLYAAALG